jgi:hypothetical protein
MPFRTFWAAVLAAPAGRLIKGSSDLRLRLSSLSVFFMN